MNVRKSHCVVHFKTLLLVDRPLQNMCACMLIVGTFCSDMETPFTRDEEQEDLVQRMIYDNARGPEPDEDVDDDFFTSQFLNDSGDGVRRNKKRRRRSGLNKLWRGV